MALKAYTVTETDDGTGGIVFAEHNVVARRNGSSQFSDGDFHSVTCRRTPWADQYAPGPVPELVMLDHGWWFTCHGCEARLDCDCDGEGGVDRAKFIDVAGSIYCSTECRERHVADKAERKRQQSAAIAGLTARLLAKLPAVEVVTGTGGTWDPHAYVVKRDDGTWVRQQCVVAFKFPGCKVGFGQYRYDKIGEEPHFSVCNGDREAWIAWCASIKAGQR